LVSKLTTKIHHLIENGKLGGIFEFLLSLHPDHISAIKEQKTC
jgi:hypothetical protein